MRSDRFAPLPEADAGELYRLVAAHDEARALSLAFAPDGRRAAALTACAFVAEAASIPARVSDPMIGMIRVQWWREALEEAFGAGAVRAHPLVRGLRQTLDGSVRAGLEGVLGAIPAFLEGGGGVPLDLLRSTDGAMGGLVARIVSPDGDGTLAAKASAVAALGRCAAAPPQPARSPQIETPRQRASRLDIEGAHVREAAEGVRRDWPKNARDGEVIGSLPFALTMAHAAGRVPGPLRTRLAMTRMVARGKP